MHSKIHVGDKSTIASNRISTDDSPVRSDSDLSGDRTTLDSQHLVGRREQTIYFKKALNRCIAGSGQLIMVYGGAGTGKSLLLKHFKQITEEKAQVAIRPSAVLSSIRPNCHSKTQQDCSPGADLLGFPSTSLATTASSVSSCANISNNIELDLGKASCNDLLASQISLLSLSHPTAIFIDDFHRAPIFVRSFVCSLSRMLVDVPLLVTVSVDTNVRSNGLAAKLRECAEGQLVIDAFTNPQICELLRYNLPTAPANEAAVAEQLRMLTGGNPRITNQLIKDLIIGEAFTVQGGVWKLAKLIEDDCLSAAIAGMCKEWISRVSESCALVLKRAAVIGDRFEVDCLKGILQTEDDVSSALDEANEAGIVTHCKGNALGDYAFVSKIMGSYLYHLERPEIRRYMHGNIARYWETHADGIGRAHLSSMAEHYRKAHRTGSPDPALRYSIQAAESMIENGNIAEARTHLAEALTIARDHDSNRLDLARILELLGDITSGWSLGSAIELLEESLHYYEVCHQKSGATRLHGKLGILLSLTYTSMDARRASAHQNKARQLLKDISDTQTAASLNLGVALCAEARLSAESGLLASSLSMKMAESAHDLDTWCMAAATHACALWARGQFREAFELTAIGRGRITSGNSPAAGFSLTLADGFMRLLLWDPCAAETALRSRWHIDSPDVMSSHQDILESHVGFAKIFAGHVEEARQISERCTNAFLHAQVKFCQGNWRTARTLLMSEFERVRETEDIRKQWGIMFYLARLDRAELNLSIAERTLRRALTIGQVPLPAPHEVCTRTELALILLQLNRINEAQAELRRCHEIAQEGENWRGIQGLITRAKAACLAWSGDIEGSRVEFESARAIFDLYRLPWEQAENDVIWGYALLVLTGDLSMAECKFASAIDLYVGHSFGQTWIDRVALIRNVALSASQAEVAGSQGTLDSDSAEGRRPRPIRAANPNSDDIYDLVSTKNIALIATLTHDAIAHIVSCVDKLAKLQPPLTRIADAVEGGASALKSMNTFCHSRKRQKKPR